MPSVEASRMRVVMFVELNGEPYRVTLPNERMELLLPLAASLFDNGKLGLAPTVLFKFPPTPVPGMVEEPSSKVPTEARGDGVKEPSCAALGQSHPGDTDLRWCYRCGEGVIPGMCRASKACVGEVDRG